MAEPSRQPDALCGARLLVVEDDYLIASDLAWTLENRGVEVVGPAGSVADALALIKAGDGLDGAVLDVDLGHERSYLIADALIARGVPFVFATGYDAWVVPDAYAGVPRCEKPYDAAALARALKRQMRR